jgi:hypothetical protein
VLQSAHDLRVSNVTIANGSIIDVGPPPIGGCLYVGGDLYLKHATITDCHVIATGTAPAFGGAIATSGYATLKYSSVTNSSASSTTYVIGGGVFAGKTTGVLSSTISGNSVTQSNGTTITNAAVGGGVAANISTYVINSTLSGNSANASGGSYYNPTTMMTYTEYGVTRGGGSFSRAIGIMAASTVTGNFIQSTGAAYGGAVYAGTTSGIYVSDVSSNTASSQYQKVYGGALMAKGAINVAASAFSGNQALSDCTYCFSGGGAIFAVAGVSLSGSTLSGNLVQTKAPAESVGGAICTPYPSTSTTLLTDSTVSGNSSTSTGQAIAGAIAGGASPITLNNSTIAFNVSTTNSGGIFGGSGAHTFYSSILANNSSGDPLSADFLTPAPNTVVGSNNLVMVAAGGALPADTLSSDPLLKPLAFNGGFTQTHALDPASPAVDTGLNPLSLTGDQRGAKFPRVVGAAADIGAYELDTDRIFTDGFEIRLQ